MANLVGGKTVNLDLAELNGNVFNLIGAFRRQAKSEKWTAAEIKLVQDAATSGNYDNALQVLIAHCEPVGEDYADGDSEDYGGAFDGFTVTSDADPGL